MEPSRYGPFPYVPINRRPKLTLPNNARVALWIVPNIEFFPLNERMPDGPGSSGGLIPDVHMWANRDYGGRVGVFRMMEAMEKHGLRGTVALNSEVCDAYPEVMEDAMKLGWEFMGHCQANTRRLVGLDAETDRKTIAETLARIEKATGKRPRGWLGAGLQESWSTVDNLAAEGCLYVADWVNDDQPYKMKLAKGSLYSIPYSSEINDKVAFEYHHLSGEGFGELIKRQFDVLYREGAESGRVMCIALHPYLIGHPHRSDFLEKAFAYICRHEGVWKATGEEIIRHYAETTG
jgi:allantoinase